MKPFLIVVEAIGTRINAVVNEKMQKISSKNVINKLIQLTGWNKTRIADEIFGITLSNLGNYTREDRLDFYKIFEWSKKNNLNIDFNWLLENKGPFNQISQVAETPSQYGDPNNNVIPIDPAVQMVIEVEKEVGKQLNDKQRKAVVDILRRELNQKLSEQKDLITQLISSF